MSGQEPDIEKRLLLAVVLSMAILLGAPYLFDDPEQPQPPDTATPQTLEGGSQPAAAAPSEEPTAEPAELQAATPAPVTTRGEARTVVVENDVLRLTISTSGAVVEGIQLKAFNTPAGEPVQLLPAELPREQGRPLQVSVGDEFLDGIIGTEPYALTGADADLVQAPATLVLELSDENIQVVKTLEIPASGYQLALETRVIRSGRDAAHRLMLGPGLGPGTARENDFVYPAAVYYSGGEATHFYDLDEEVTAVQAPAAWVGLDTKYFALLLLSPVLTGMEADLLTWTGSDGTERTTPRLNAKLDQSGRHRLFAGPKQPEVLAQTDPSLREANDYGWFTVLVEPLLFGLKLFYGFVGNYGLAIILLTFAINLALFPLRYKQIVSMSKMSALQPKIKSIQDKYKRMKRDDPRRQQMNQEVMGLYKEHGVNPLGGCLPLLFQMPILFAFYRMLDQSIELRGAPFFAWIQDLSQPDPYLVTPILMGLTMVWQQKMTPTTADPAQKRMMMFLPLVFTVMFLWVSSGLALYFLFSNVFAMMFQLLLQSWKPELVGTPAKAAKGKKKRG